MHINLSITYNILPTPKSNYFSICQRLDQSFFLKGRRLRSFLAVWMHLHREGRLLQPSFPNHWGRDVQHLLFLFCRRKSSIGSLPSEKLDFVTPDWRGGVTLDRCCGFLENCSGQCRPEKRAPQLETPCNDLPLRRETLNCLHFVYIACCRVKVIVCNFVQSWIAVIHFWSSCFSMEMNSYSLIRATCLLRAHSLNSTKRNINVALFIVGEH